MEAFTALKKKQLCLLTDFSPLLTLPDELYVVSIVRSFTEVRTSLSAGFP